MLDRAVDALLDVLLIAVAIVAALALAPAPPDRASGVAAAGPDRAALEVAIDAMLVAAPAAAEPYDRAQFPHWLEIIAGCDTRCVVLDRQRSAGGWRSAYDGYVATHRGELDIDHVVPLAEAWVSGASGWTLSRRQAFANDLASGELLAVTSWSNRDKGAADPASWRPPDPGWWCSYADAWVGVKLRWGLTADAAEIDALYDMAEHC
jgi:hypothetical protein